MFEKVAQTESPRTTTTWRFEERMVSDGQIVESWPLPGRDAEAAWQRFRLELKLHPHRYTPYNARRLMLLAVGGAR